MSGFLLFALAIGEYALIAFVSMQAVLANLFVIKQITLGGMNATSADAFMVGAMLGVNLLQEYFGKKAARQAIIITFFLLLFYLTVSQIQVYYLPSVYDFAHPHFSAILTVAPRIVVASFLVYALVQILNYYVYSFLHMLWDQQYLVTRNYVTVIFCQLLDTMFFGFLGLYGIVEHIWQVILVSCVIKCVIIAIAVPFVGFSRFIIKK